MEAKEWDELAERYHDEVISPFYGKVKNPIYDELASIKNKNKKSIAEFGCGLLYLHKELSCFKEVHASDFSQKMVDIAALKAGKYKNISIKKEDLRNINHKNKFDVVISVNAVIMPSLNDIKKCFKNIHSSLKSKGQVFMILPSMESVLYHGMLLLNDENLKNENKAVKSAKGKFEHKKYDMFLGIYNEQGDKQKFYYEHELVYLLKKAGFKDIKISKVLYPWGKDISDYKSFPKEDKLWDWFVSARK
jgi:trans-aconitate methyltransferase